MEITCKRITVMQEDETEPHIQAGLFFISRQKKKKPAMDACLIQLDDSVSLSNLAELGNHLLC